MLEGLVDELKDGMDADGYLLSIKNQQEGRVSKQEYFDVFLEKGKKEKELMHMSVYHGNMPYYKPWVELFGISPEVRLGDDTIKYFDSRIEDRLLDIVSSHLKKGGRIFVEYQKDEETRYGLTRGYPAAVTRLGNILYKRNFTWFKDWYFPEGFKEGGEKLQAEKAIDEEHREKHESIIQEEIEEFLSRKDDYEDTAFKNRAVKRAEEIV